MKISKENSKSNQINRKVSFIKRTMEKVKFLKLLTELRLEGLRYEFLERTYGHYKKTPNFY